MAATTPASPTGASGTKATAPDPQDTNGDGVFTERPAFATADTDPEDLRRTRFGDFDLTPEPGQELIPRNLGLGPSFFSVNLGISRSIAFGNVPGPANAAAKPAGAAPGGAAAAPAPSRNSARLRARAARSAWRPLVCRARGRPPAQPAGARPASGPSPEKKYTLTFSVNIQNLLNNTNLSQPIGNLSSPRFGESFSTAGSFGFGPSGSAAAGNRRIQLQVRFGF